MLISRRRLAENLGVNERAIRKAIETGRISSQAIHPSGRLIYGRAKAEFEATRSSGHNNRYGELEADEGYTPGDPADSVELPFWYNDHGNPDAGLDQIVDPDDRLFEWALRQAASGLIHTLECAASNPEWLSKAKELSTAVSALHDAVLDVYYGPEDLTDFQEDSIPKAPAQCTLEILEDPAIADSSASAKKEEVTS